MTQFNPQEELRRLAALDEGRLGRKLPFARQCAAFAALYEGVAPKVVGFAFKISPQTVSYLSGCLQEDPDPFVRELVETVEEVGGEKRYRAVERISPRDHNERRKATRFRRYADVALEFEALGKEEFLRRYMTPEIVERLTEARREVSPTGNAVK